MHDARYRMCGGSCHRGGRAPRRFSSTFVNLWVMFECVSRSAARNLPPCCWRGNPAASPRRAGTARFTAVGPIALVKNVFVCGLGRAKRIG
jgi:hypothetical protein